MREDVRDLGDGMVVDGGVRAGADLDGGEGVVVVGVVIGAGGAVAGGRGCHCWGRGGCAIGIMGEGEGEACCGEVGRRGGRTIGGWRLEVGEGALRHARLSM